ncbi:DUF5320 domain-containing protein [Methanolacinia petrolearia]|uniref:DUF5320 domain-containing protein n=1 Tax=Methanolacinia petrolearia TaxID=54120 RepID=UPI0009FCDB69|nr:DUF5320 domain-containing protein [Methanolacinia petrolearia]
MPGFNRTGPNGMGSMTGWGRGNCVPADSQASSDAENKVLNEGDPNTAGNPVNTPAGFYGLGRGGMPCGCGRRFGGGRGRRSAAGGRGFGGRGRF